MSKAFTRESDDLPERPVLASPAPRLPPGTKNYLTFNGEKLLREELDRLVQIERPHLTTCATADAKHQLQRLDQRIAHLRQSLQSAVVVPPPAASDGQVHFGATVRLRERSGLESRYRIVGIDEVNLDLNWVSWQSPIARALLKARVGERVSVRLPGGEEQFEILEMTYE